MLKHTPRRLLKKMTDLLLVNCKPERIDHGDFKYGDLEDDVQPEIPASPKTSNAFTSYEICQIFDYKK